MRLEPLAESDSGRLLENLLGEVTIAAPVRERIAQAAGGNPLFVEELVAMLLEEGLLRRENGSWVVTEQLAEITIPPSLSALLGARLDQLGEERPALERGAIEGQVFHRGAVAALSSPDAKAALAAGLATLLAKELLRPAEASFAGEAAYRFRHILIRDAAYETTPKKLRAELHERFADWLEKSAGERVTEYEEILGYHLEQAFHYREELGPVDESGRRLAARGARLLADTGRRATARGDMPAAANLLDRAAKLLRGNAARFELLPELGMALAESGDYEKADCILGEAIEAAVASGDSLLQARAALQREQLRGHTDPEGFAGRALILGKDSIAVFDRFGDDEGLGWAWQLVGDAHMIQGRLEQAGQCFQRALTHARRAGDERQEAMSMFWASLPLNMGLAPVEECLRQVEGDVEWARARGNRTLEGTASYALGWLEAMRGRVDEARRLVAHCRLILEDLGQPVLLAAHEGTLTLPLLLGDPTEAESTFRSSYEALERLGEKNFLSTVAANLAEAVYRQGRYDEAERWTRISEELGADDDLYTQSGWRCVRAKVLAREGREDDAERLAREAVAIAMETEILDSRAEALVSLAEVLRLTGRPSEARPYLEEALAMWEEKGNVVSAAKARSLLMG